MRAKLFLTGLIVAASCVAASAQQAQTVRLRGANLDHARLCNVTMRGDNWLT